MRELKQFSVMTPLSRLLTNALAFAPTGDEKNAPKITKTKLNIVNPDYNDLSSQILANRPPAFKGKEFEVRC